MTALAPAHSGSGSSRSEHRAVRCAPLRPAQHQPGRASRRRRTVAWLVAAAATWPLAAGLHAAGLDPAMLGILLLSVCALLPAGQSVLDRLVLGTVVLSALVLTFGWVASLWPFGLHPVAVGTGCEASVLVIAAATGARPRRALRVQASDAAVVAAGAVAALALWHPLRSASLQDRLMMSATAEDRAAHYALFATIRRIGGYPFLQAAQARVTVQHPTELVYPSGSHLLWAVVDEFRLGGRTSTPLAGFDRYFGYVLISYLLLVVGAVWAVRWVAGPVRWWQGLLGCSAAAGLLLAGPLPQLLGSGFDSEIAGLAVLAVVIAVAVRPLPGALVNAGVVSCLMVVQAYVYSPFLLIAAPALLCGYLVHRQALLRPARPVCAVLLGGAVLALLPTGIAESSGFSASSQALHASGGRISLSGAMVLSVAVLALLPLLIPSARRNPTVRAAAFVTLTIIVVLIAFVSIQLAGQSGNGYYFLKLLTGEYLLGVVLLGSALAALAGTPITHQHRAFRAGWQVSLLVAAVVAAVALPAYFQTSSDGEHSQTAAASHAAAATLAASTHRPFSAVRASPLGLWYRGDPDVPLSIAPALAALDRAGLLTDGVPSLYVCSSTAYYNWRLDYYSAALNGNLGRMARAAGMLLEVRLTGRGSDGSLLPAGGSLSAEALRSILRAVAGAQVADLAEPPVRIVTTSPDAATQLRTLLAQHRELRATVLQLPPL